jgi:hypothetical protein
MSSMTGAAADPGNSAQPVTANGALRPDAAGIVHSIFRISDCRPARETERSKLHIHAVRATSAMPERRNPHGSKHLVMAGALRLYHLHDQALCEPEKRGDLPITCIMPMSARLVTDAAERRRRIRAASSRPGPHRIPGQPSCLNLTIPSNSERSLLQVPQS